MKRIILTMALGLSLFGCQSEESELLAANDGPVAVEFTQIGKNEMMGAENVPEANLVIDNAEDWNTLKAQMDQFNQYTSGFDETEIDFSLYRVIAVIDEVRMYGGYSIDVVSVSNDRDRIVVDVERSEGGPGAGATVITQPFHIVKIPVSDLPVVFE